MSLSFVISVLKNPIYIIYMSILPGCPPSVEALTYGVLQLQKKIKNMS